MSSTPSAGMPQKHTPKPQQQAERRREPIGAFKATRCDLVVGEVEFVCEHKFSYMLPYSLERTGPRGFGNYGCPSCEPRGEGTCLVCLSTWSPGVHDTCPCCASFFVRKQLTERLRLALGEGKTIAPDNPVAFRVERHRLRQQRENRRVRFVDDLELRSKCSRSSSEDSRQSESSTDKSGRLE